MSDAAFLHGLGITDTSVLAAYGIGTVDEALLAALRPGKRRLTSAGALWPTRDPRDPDRPVGVVRLAPAQNKHAFVTEPVGLGCTVDVLNAPRVLLCDTPLTVLRLAQEGVQHLALCEDPAVLQPLADWLRERTVILLSHKQRGLDAMAAGLGDVPHRSHLIGAQPERMAAEVRDLLALPAVPPPPRIDPTPHCLHRLADYARDRLKAGEGIDAIRSRGFDHADLLAAYGAGYLPAQWQQVLSRADEPLMTGRMLGHSLVFPAVDAAGVVVDLLAVRLCRHGGLVGCWDEPRGLIGARIARACRTVILVDRASKLARLWRAGYRNVLFIRGVDDLRNNAERLLADGVCSIQMATSHHRADYHAACQEAGFDVGDGPSLGHDDPPDAIEDVTPVVVIDEGAEDVSSIDDGDSAEADPALTPAIELINHDSDRGLATFAADDITYVVEVPWEQTTILEVLARRLGQVHRDRFDLASDAQRTRFADAASRRLQVPSELIADHALALLDAVRALVDEPDAPTDATAIIDSTHADASTEELLRDPSLLDQLTTSLGTAGWVGDDAAKRLGLLCLAGRLLDDPPWLLLKGPATVTASPLGLLADCVPPEWRLHCSRITEASLYHQDRDALRHKVLVLDDAATLRAEALTALRILQTRGGLAVTQAERDPATGRLRTCAADARGPVALLAATATETALADLSIGMPLDATPEQTVRVLSAQATRRQGAADPRPAVIEQLRSALRRLERLPVRIPFADRIDFPATRLEHRRDHDRFLALIEASTLLHQHQRPRVDGHLIATEADFHHALQAAGTVLGQEDDGVSDRAKPLLAALRTQPDHDWTMAEMAGALPHLSRGTLRRAINDLTSVDLVVSPRSGRGRRARIYQLVDGDGDTGAAQQMVTIHLLATPSVTTTPSYWSIGQGVANKVTNLSDGQDKAYA